MCGPGSALCLTPEEGNRKSDVKYFILKVVTGRCVTAYSGHLRLKIIIITEGLMSTFLG